MRARFAIASILLGLISTTAVAHAQDGRPPSLSPAKGQISSTAPQEPRQEYYGWQVMLADAASLALLFNDEGTWLGVGGYALGGPIVHAAHGNVGSTLASAGLRAGLPVLGFFAGVILVEQDSHCGEEEYDCDDGFAALGAGLALGALGVVSAVAIDWLALGWDDRPASPASGRSLVVVPQVGVSENGASLGVLGRF